MITVFQGNIPQRIYILETFLLLVDEVELIVKANFLADPCGHGEDVGVDTGQTVCAHVSPRDDADQFVSTVYHQRAAGITLPHKENLRNIQQVILVYSFTFYIIKCNNLVKYIYISSHFGIVFKLYEI